MLTSNGAAITDLEKNEIFYENCLDPGTVEAAVEMLKDTDYILEGFIGGGNRPEETRQPCVQKCSASQVPSQRDGAATRKVLNPTGQTVALKNEER